MYKLFLLTHRYMPKIKESSGLLHVSELMYESDGFGGRLGLLLLQMCKPAGLVG
jgi:hypothetical protein